MVGVGVFIVVEAIDRIGTDPQVASTPMLVVGLIGLAVNGVGLILLKAGSRESINIRGAYLEVLGDAAGSVGVLIAALLIRWTGSSVWDVVVALIIGVFGRCCGCSGSTHPRVSTRLPLKRTWPRCPASSRCTTCTCGP